MNTAPLKIVILGINGFIGSHLAERILADTNWTIHGLDLHDHHLAACREHPRLQFHLGDMQSNHALIENWISQADAVLPLVAIANPALYVQDPLRIFELDFEANLAIVRLCVKHRKRLIFPSTSEVYGLCPDSEFNEETSPLVTGPINKQRWIYSCAKQMMDRVIYAYHLRGELVYTLFRPFNWIGSRLDDLSNAKAKQSRVLTQFIGNIMRGEPIYLVNGGKQQRCFTFIEDGIDALMKIIANERHCADNRIFNLGNPANNISIKGLAEMLITAIKTYPNYAHVAEQTQLVPTSAEAYYGEGYDDVALRVPAIKNARDYLAWQPKTDLSTAIKKTLDVILLNK